MKLKLSRSQFNALYALLEHYIFNKPADNINDKLLHAHMLELFIKMHKKGPVALLNYNIKLTVTEALSFWLAWNFHDYPNTSFEGNLLNQITTRIHKEFAYK